MFLELFRWLEANLPGGAYLRDSTFGFSILLTVHVVSLCIFFGLILMMDLRLVGWGNLRTRAADMSERLLPFQMVGFIIMTITGLALVWAQPLRYYGKAFFWWKMGLMVLAGINAGVIHLITRKSEDAWDSGAAKFAGATSIVLWVAVLALGRLVAYEWYTTEYFLE
jgi:uncharacterized membrane protein